MRRAILWFVVLPAVCWSCRSQVPAADSKPGVRVGEGTLERTKWADVKSIGLVTSIFQPAGESTRIGLGGRDGAAWVNVDGTLISTVKLPPQRSFVEFVDLEADGAYEILDRGGHGWSPAELYDAQGMNIWTYPKGGFDSGTAIDDLASGDLDGDGKPEFVAGYNGSDGLRRVDRSGVDVWQKKGGNIWHVEIVDMDGDGKNDIIHSGGIGGGLTIRDSAGEVKKALPAGTQYVSKFSITQARDRAAPARLAIGGDQELVLLSGDGTKSSYPCKLSSKHAIPSVAEVRWTKEGPLQLAVLLSDDRHRQSASVFVLYDQDGRQIYEEVLDEPCLVLSVLPNDENGDRLLLGGAGTVWEYKPKK